MAWRDQGSLTKLVLMVGLVVLVCVTFGVRACPPGCTCTRKKAPGSGSGGDNPGDSLVDDADPSGDSGNGVPGHQGAPLSPASISSRGKKIDCSNNPARFTDLSQIEPNILPLDTIQLDLSNNALTAIPTAAFDDLSMLRKLDLSDNEIGLLEPGAFQGLGNLERLDLSGNKIGSINASMFMGMPKLEKLYLSKNRLNTIPEGTFNPLPALKRIDFQSEYLRCDCHLQWMVQWIRDRDVRIRASTICAVPREVTGKPFKQLKKKDLHCEHELQLPLFEVSPSTSQVVFQGDKLPFECRASVIDPATRMIWLRRGKEVYTNRTLGIFVHTATSPDRTVMTHSLVLESLERQHNGIWQCRVSTPQGNVSNSVTITVISDNAMSCPEVTVRTNKGVYIWERTVAGIQKQQPCKVGQKRAPATYYCNNMGNWEHLNVKQCDFISETTRKLQTCAEWDFDDEGSVTQLAQQFLPQSRALRDSVDVVFASNCISRITQFVQHVPALSDPILNAIDSVMKVDKTLLAKAQREDKACSRLVGIVEWLARQLLTTPAHNALSENIAIEARNMSVTPFRGIACTTGLRRDHVIEDLSDGLDELTCMESMNETLFARAAAEITEDDPDIDPYVTPFNMTDFDQDVDAAILLPRTLVQKVPVLKGVSMGKVGVTIIVYSDAAFFPVTAGTHDDPVLQGSEWQPVSPVISASIGQSVANLTDPVIGLLKVSDPSRRLVAAYWDFDANGGLGDWRTEGCRITEQHGNVSVFHCYHLTNFVILQNLSSLLVGVFIMMEPVIYAGSCLLAICLMIVIVTYVTCFKFIRIPKKAKHSVINISVSILLLCMGFTMGVNRTDQVLACQLVGITIHYFTLCAIFWITITSSNMLKKFTKAEEPPAPPPEPIPMPLPPKPILRFYLLGWGVPIIICGITAAVNLNHYRQSEYCFLSWDPSLGAFYGPVALLVIINLVFFMRISYVIRGAPNNLNYSDEMEELHTNEIELTPNQEFTNIETASLTHTNATSMSSILDTEHRPISQLRALVATLFLYIVVWVCGAFAVARPFRTIIPRQEKIFSYLYGFTSLVLGCFMLGYYCLMRQDSRLSWKRFFSCKQQPAVYNVNVNCETEAPSRVAHTNGHVVRCASSVESSSLTGKVVNIQKEQKQQHNNHNHQHMKNSSRKTSNINLVPSQTASLTEVSFGSIGQDQSYPSFYNPRQNGVAKKFWEKRNHQTKKINKDLGKEINTCSGSYNSNLDNILNDTASKRHSQGTSSDANTHFSIEIQIQANPRNSESNGRVPSGQDEMPPSYDSIRRNKQLPMNIQATHQSAFHAVVPYDRSQMAPGVGGSVVDTCADSVCSSSHYPMSQPESSIPFCSQSTCMNTLGVHTEAPCGCDKYRVQHRSPNRSVTSSPAGSELLQPNISMPRPRDFDGQSQVSQETQGSSLHTRLQPQQLPLLGHPQKHLPAIDQDCCTECLNNVNDNNMLNSQRCMSDSSKQYRTSSDYSSDSNVRKRRQKNFLQELERRIPADEAVNSPVRSDVTQQRHVYAQPNNRRHNHHDSDSQLHYYRSRSNDFSDHNSEPSHRKRHHSHGSARNRNRNRNRHSKQSYGSELQTSSEWDEQFRDRPQKIPYAYVNHRYRERLRQKRLQESGRVGVDPGTKVYWFPKSTSTSAYDEILPGGMEAMAEDTSSSSDNSIDEDIWVLQKERRNRLKKETSV